MSLDLTLLREREDNAANAISSLRRSEKWALIQLLFAELGLRELTQVNVSDEKIKAFKREQDNNV